LDAATNHERLAACKARYDKLALVRDQAREDVSQR
jgi:hypothetical protein